MTAVSRADRAVPLPEWAPDFVLRFTTSDLIALEEFLIGDDPAPVDPKPKAEKRETDLSAPKGSRLDRTQRRLSVSWLGLVQQLLDRNDAAFVRAAIRLALKAPGGVERPTLLAQHFDDLPFAPGSVVQKIEDAIACAISGRGYADVIAAREAKAETDDNVIHSAPRPDAATA